MKKLYRSKTDRKVAGVCGGLGEFFGFDPTLARLVFVFLSLPGGAPGILPYLVLWLVIPEDK